MRKIISVVVGCGLVAGGQLRGAETNPPLPTVTPAVFSAAPAIDGDLSDAAWQQAAQISLDRVVGSNSAPAVRTEALIGRDADNLYLGVTCADSFLRTPVAGHTGANNVGADADDHIEIILAPYDHLPFHLYYFVLGAGNARRQQLVVGPPHISYNISESWSAAWRSATAVRRGGWTAEVAIPLAALDYYADTPVRFNVVRVKRTRPEQVLSWAPVTNVTHYFHGDPYYTLRYYDRDRLGRLAGLPAPSRLPVFTPLIQQAEALSLYREKDGKFSYEIALTMANPGGKSGAVDVIVEDRTADGVVTRLTHHVENCKGQNIITVPVAYPADRTARVIIAAEETGQNPLWTPVWKTDTLAVLTAYPNLNYFSGEPEGRLTIGTAYPDAMFQGLKRSLQVTIRDSKGRKVIGQTYQAISNQGVVVPLPLRTWAPGIYPVEILLANADDREIASLRTQVRVVPPPPADIHVSKLDHERMCMLTDGQPVFIYSYCSYSYGGAGAKDAFGEDLAAKYKTAGFNLITSWNLWGVGGDGTRWSPERESRLTNVVARENQAIAAAYQEQGLLVAQRLEGVLIRPVGSTTPAEHSLLTNKLPVVVNGLKNNPGLLMYYGIDEPTPTPELNVQAALVRELDPYHLQFASCCQYVSAKLYRAYDFYFIHHYWDPAHGPNGLASLIREGARTAKLFRVPIVATPQGQRTTYARELLPQERLAGLVLPVINGAKGIMFWGPDEAAVHPVIWRVFAYAGKMYQALAPMLLNNPPPQNVLVTAASAETPVEVPPLPNPRTLFDPSWEGKFIPVNVVQMPVIQACIWDLSPSLSPVALSDVAGAKGEALAKESKRKRGELILVCNSTRWPVSASLALSSIWSAQSRLRSESGDVSLHSPVREYFSGKEIPVKNGRFSIDFEPYGVRVLETIWSTRLPGAPVSLGIAVIQPAEPPPLAPAGVNLARNGDLDSDDLTAWRQGGRVTLVTNAAHTGARSLRLEGVMTNQTTDLGQVIALQPNTKYRLSVWMKSAIRSGRLPASCFVHFNRESGLSNCGINPVDASAPEDAWREYALTITTGDNPAQASFYCRMPPYTDGYILVDDMRVEDLRATRQQRAVPEKLAAPAKEAQPGSALIYSRADDLAQMADGQDALPPQPGENILKNASFEEYTLPQMPDHWLTHMFTRGYIGQDVACAKDGQYSVMLLPTRSHRSLMQLWWNWKPGQTYTLSLWARAEKPGSVLRLLAGDDDAYTYGSRYHDAALTADWQRYMWTFQAPKKADADSWGRAAAIGLWNLDPTDNQLKPAERPKASGKIWIDAAQLELGSQATDFKPDSYKAPTFDKKWLSDKVFEELEKKK